MLHMNNATPKEPKKVNAKISMKISVQLWLYGDQRNGQMSQIKKQHNDTAQFWCSKTPLGNALVSSCACFKKS